MTSFGLNRKGKRSIEIYRSELPPELRTSPDAHVRGFVKRVWLHAISPRLYPRLTESARYAIADQLPVTVIDDLAEKAAEIAERDAQIAKKTTASLRKQIAQNLKTFDFYIRQHDDYPDNTMLETQAEKIEQRERREQKNPSLKTFIGLKGQL